MSIRTYRLTSVTPTTVVGQALTNIIAKGRIVGVAACMSANGGASAGTCATELALNNNVNGNQTVVSGAPSENLLARLGLSASGAAASVALSQYLPSNRPVVPGNTLCINTSSLGTSLVQVTIMFDVFVEEA